MTQNQAKTREHLQDAASSGIWLKLNVCTAKWSMVITGIWHESWRCVSALWWKCVFSLRNDVSQFKSRLSAKLTTVIYAVTNESLLYVVMSTLLQPGISESSHIWTHCSLPPLGNCIDGEIRFWFCFMVLTELLKIPAGGWCAAASSSALHDAVRQQRAVWRFHVLTCSTSNLSTSAMHWELHVWTNAMSCMASKWCNTFW